MKKIDLVLNIDPGNAGLNNLKKITTAFEALAVVLDTIEILLKELSTNLSDFTKKFGETQKSVEKFADTMKNIESGGSRISDIIKALSEKIDDLTKKLEKLQ
jgi:predicted nuclease with TOPRIM domain